MLMQLLLELVGLLRDREQNKHVVETQQVQQKSSPVIIVINNNKG